MNQEVKPQDTGCERRSNSRPVASLSLPKCAGRRASQSLSAWQLFSNTTRIPTFQQDPTKAWEPRAIKTDGENMLLTFNF